MPKLVRLNLKYNMQLILVYCFLLSIPLGLGLCFFWSYGVLFTIILLCIEISLFFVFAVPYANYQRRIMTILDEECNPDEYTALLHEMLIICRGKVQKIPLLLDKFLGYLESGQYQNGFHLLQSIDINQRDFILIYKVLYFNNLAVYYICLQNYTAAQNYLDQSIQLSNSKGINKKVKIQIAKIHSSNQFVIHLANHETEGFEDCFIQRIQYTQTKRICSHDHFSLAKYYLLTQELDKAKAHLHEVVKYGNKLYIVEEAKDILRSLEV